MRRPHSICCFTAARIFTDGDSPTPADHNLLYVRGFNPATQQFVYAVNEHFGTPNTQQNVWVQPVQFTVMAQISIGQTQGGPMGMMPMVAGGKTGAASATGSDSLRTRVAATLPNVARRVLALDDSLHLALTPQQRTQLAAIGDAYQPRVDATVSKIVTSMSAPVKGGDATTVAAQLRAQMDDAHTLAQKTLDDTRAVLTAAQWDALPPALKKLP